jgi:type IV pilus assembly protein PilE
MRRRNRGVTLIELLMVMIVIAILSAIAIPSYRNYMIRTNRTEAKVGLLQVAGNLERCFTRTNRYDVDCDAFDNLPITTENGNYEIDADVVGGVTFTLTAEARNGQEDDTQCGDFTLTSANEQDVTGTEDPERCWGR